MSPKILLIIPLVIASTILLSFLPTNYGIFLFIAQAIILISVIIYVIRSPANDKPMLDDVT